MVSEGWSSTKLGSLVKIYSGVAPADLLMKTEGKLPYVKVEDMNIGLKYQVDSRLYVDESPIVVPKGATLFPKRGAAIMNNKVRIADVDFVIDSNMMAIFPAKGLDQEFLYYLILHLRLYKIADTSTIPQINNKHILPLKVGIPSLSEQKIIAKILSIWDQAIIATEQLLANSRQQKKALMQRLLSGRLRLPGFNAVWKKLPLANCLAGSSLRNAGMRLGLGSIRSVNKAEGMIPMREQTIGKAVDRYKVVRPGWFAYNPMRINVGSICRWNGTADCLVSPDYVVFHCKEQLLLGDYLDQFRQSGRWIDYMESAGNGSVRVRIYLEDLNQLEIPLPPLDEQKKIVAALEAADREIETLQQQLDCLKQEKKALMQQLLTGKRRVKIDET